MAYNPNVPAPTNRVQDDIAAMRDNFQHLAPLAPYIQAILDSRIVEMGSNSNGEYVRWEKGLQVCFTELATSASADTLWTLPAAFIDSKWVFASGVGASFNAGVRVMTLEGRTTSSVSLRVFQESGVRASSGAFIIAIGRWK